MSHLCSRDGHLWHEVGQVYRHSERIPNSALACVSRTYACKACPKEKRVLTPAGIQQLEAGDSLNVLLGYVKEN